MTSRVHADGFCRVAESIEFEQYGVTAGPGPTRKDRFERGAWRLVFGVLPLQPPNFPIYVVDPSLVARRAIKAWMREDETILSVEVGHRLHDTTAGSFLLVSSSRGATEISLEERVRRTVQQAVASEILQGRLTETSAGDEDDVLRQSSEADAEADDLVALAPLSRENVRIAGSEVRADFVSHGLHWAAAAPINDVVVVLSGNGGGKVLQKLDLEPFTGPWGDWPGGLRASLADGDWPAGFVAPGFL